ncbi:MAG TPA: zinc ABC transporter substrate-binding protein [Caldithrix abyssi]|uniref:Zinc ABC transporter substrate-binding protein n=1 Tax=Caldithrix abyssi TaxID=187145 RepID=A0A7V4TYZ6_CALAY|nr:zinc ABC transporter substrate-binding protein [Caldithrix abyssi]
MESNNKKINLNRTRLAGVILVLSLFFLRAGYAADRLNVVTTLSTYADIAKQIGKERIEVQYIVPGDQDAHFVRPKPSYAVMLSKADVFVTTGLDLELWVPSVVDMSKNDHIRSGQEGYVAAYDGIELLDKPTVLSRSEGGLHIYGNPHITTSPLNWKIIAENIAIGLIKNDPANEDFYRQNLSIFQKEIDKRLFGETLVKLMGGSLLTKLALSGQLIDFLQNKSYAGKKLIDYLGGWLGEGLVFRNKKIVAYHKNWVYFKQLFGLDIIGYVEPKPGIPPSPKHVEDLIVKMKKNNIKVILAANYFDENKVRNICAKVNAVPVIVPIYVNGAPGTENVFKLADYWVSHLKAAWK